MIPQELVAEILFSGLSVKHVVVGSGFRFGINRTGRTRKLAELAGKRSILTTVVSKLGAFSSTSVQAALHQGDIAMAIISHGDNNVGTPMGTQFGKC